MPEHPAPMKNVEDIYPLTPLQSGMLFHSLMAPESGVYVQQITCTLPADLDGGLFRQAWERLIARHGILRTAFFWEGLDEPRQVVRKSCALPWRELDWGGLPDAERQRRFEELCQSDRLSPLPLTRAPLMRLSLVRFDRGLGFIWTSHHLLMDGWSRLLLVQELESVYVALRDGREPVLPPVRPFRDYAVWLQQQDPSQAEPFWRRELAGFTTPNSPGIDRLPEEAGPSGHAGHGLQVSREVTAGLQALAARHQVTLQTVTLGAWAVLLSRYGCAEDVVFGTVVSGRPATLPGVETMVGPFINTLPVRVRVRGAQPLAPWLQRLQEHQLARQEFEHAPLARIQRWSEVPGGAPLFATLYVFESHPAVGDGGSTGLRIGDLRGFGATNYPVNLTLAAADRIALQLSYDRARVDEDAVPRLLRHLAALLAGMAEGPEGVLDDLSLLTAEEALQLRAGNETASPGPPGRPLHVWIEDRADRSPDAVAVTCGTQALTWRELDRRANRLARYLLDLGVGPETRVGVLLERSTELVVALLSILEAGGAYVPLDLAYPAERIAFLLADSEAGVLLTEGSLAAAVPSFSGRIVRIDAERETIAALPARRPVRADEPAHLAYVIYTSGSTGRPKGVQVTHANLLHLFAATQERFEFGPADVWTCFHSAAFDFSVWEIWGALLSGGRLVVVPHEVGRSPWLFLDLLVREQVTVLNQTPSAFAQLAQEDARRGGAATDLRLVIFGGEALDFGSLAAWFARHGDVKPLLVNMYGITETTVHVTARPLCGRDAREERRSLIGVPVPGLSLTVMDPGLRPVPLGAPGELAVGGAGLSRGYLGRPELTAERFVPDPLGERPGARLYRSGDRGRRLAGGDVEYLGRIDQQVKIRGFRIELGEIEAALAAHPGVREAVVVARAGPGGSGDRRLIAYVVAQGAAPPAAELRRAVAARLPDYMLPAAFVALAAFPLTPNGKVDRAALPAPEQPAAESLAPRTPVEEVLAGVWAEVLGIERVGADDHFFELGGHSLLATRVASRLRSAFGVELPLGDLFAAPRLADLAARVEAALRAGVQELLPPLVPVPRDGPLPLSFAQQRLWFIDQLAPDSPLYNVAVALRIEGPLDAAVLARCLGEIVRRHEALRTVFAAREGSPVQVIRPAAPFVLPVIDLSGLPESEREPEALRLAGAEAGRPFDLARGPLLRGVLLLLAASGELTDHVAALTLHHIVSDGWSMGLLVREVAALYTAFAAGRPSPLPELPVQYADFAVWQRSWLHGEILEHEIAWWRRQLAGLPPLLELPADRPRPAVQSFRGARRRLRLSARLTRQLQSLGRREGATLFMVLLAGFQLLLARSSGQDVLAVGSPIAGRNRIETEGLIGFFANTLVLRGDLTGEPAFSALVGRARETALAAYLHQDVPFEKLVEELAPERSLAHAPLFQVMLVLQNAPAGSLEIRDLRLRPVDTEGTTAKLDLTVHLVEHDGGLAATVEHATDLQDGTTVDRLIGHFERLLAAAVATPGEPAGSLSFLSPEERAQILVEWNDTAAASAPRAWLFELFAAQARRTPEAVAVVCEDEVLTYAGLAGRAAGLAGRLGRLGAGPDVPVGLLVDRSLDMVAGVLGILQAGGACVPLDPAWPAQRLAFMLDDTGAPVLLTQEPLRGRLPAGSARAVLCIDGDGDVDPGAAVATAGEPAADHLAYVIYTSGSTGRPKGVALSHRALCNLIDWHLATLLGGARTLQLASLSFDASFHEMFACWGSGGTLVVVPEERRRDMPALADLLVEQRIEKAILPVVVLQHLAEILAGRADLPPLREVTTTGERLQTNRAMAALLRRLPGCAFHNHYGPSETHVATAFTLPPDPRDWPSDPPIGRPIRNSSACVLDPGMAPVPIGVPGDLHLGGAGLARGYLGRPGLTAERFVPDPFGGEPGARLYRTGDKVRLLAQGDLEYLGRFDGQVKIRGFRIEPGEIEALLLSLPGVREAAVLVREEREPADRRLVAYVAGDAVVEELRRALRERLPDYMVPAAFVTLAALPLTPNGKVDRKALPEADRQGSPETYLAPRTPVEEVLAGIWAEVLGLRRVGAADHFFDLGGHSLLATQVMSRLRRACGVEMPLRDLFAAPRLADLAARVEAARRSGAAAPAPALLPVPREGPLPLSFAQQRLWFMAQLEKGSPLYHVPVALHVEGPLDAAVLARCLGETVRRHEALRTVFPARDGVPAQVIRPAVPFVPPVIDLSGLPGHGTRHALALVREEAVRPFDLARGPLLRAVLLRLGTDEHVLALTLHHIVSDGWSLGLLVREVTALYPAFAAGRPSPLPELPVQYADFAVWQRSWLQGEILAEETAFWRRRLAGLPPLLALPADRPRPAVQSFRGAARPVRLPATLARQAEALARREGATLYMVLLAAFQTLLARHSGQDDLAVGTPLAGRNQAEVEELIGFFVNTLVLRGDLTGVPSFRELLGQVRETALAAHLHQDVPFDKLVEELAPERSLAHTPLFQVMFTLQNAPAESLEIRGLRLRPVGGAGTVARFDLTLVLAAHDGELAGAVEYATDLFDAATVERLIGHFARLLTAAVEAPELPAAELPLLSPAELHQAVAEWNDTRVWPAREVLLPDLLAARAARTPELPAVVQGREQISQGELALRSGRLAAHLRSLGAGPDAVVALFLERSIDLVVALFAVLEAGGAYLPLETSFPRSRLAFLLGDTRPPLVLTRTRLLPALPACSSRIVCLDDLPESAGATGPAVPPAADNLAYVLYTSGSTGAPKGVAVTHRGLANYLLWAAGAYPAGERRGAPLHSPVSFDLTVTSLFLPLLAGACVHLVPEGEGSEGLAGALAEGGFGLVKLTPAHLEMLQRLLPPGRAAGCAAALILGGEALSGEQLVSWRAHAPGLRLINEYGPTETVVGCCVHEVPASPPRPGPVPIGRPIANTRILLLDRRLEPVPIGVQGEICVGGAGVCRGYLGRPDQTAEKLVPDPSGTWGGRLYRTGDLACRLPDGLLRYLGRSDHQVKIRGFRIEPGEIEAALGALPGVREAVVVVREDRSAGGGGDRRLVAYVVGDLPGDVLRRSLSERLPDYMVPAVFVGLPALPLTSHGKVDRAALPEPGRQSSGETHVAPRTPVEEVLAGIWAELFQVERIGATDHFFDLGGHSLLAMQVMSRLRRVFEVRLRVRDLFEAPTLTGLAARVEAARRIGMDHPAPPLVPAPREGPLPLSFAQRRLWFIDQLAPDRPLYNIPVALRAEGPLDAGVLARCLGEIVRRHEALRTVFVSREGTPEQVIRPAEPFVLPVVDLSGLPAPSGLAARNTLALAAEEAARPFDLARGPLLRGVLLRRAAEDHALALTLHHIAADGWSMGILVREVAALYRAFAARRPSPLPALPVQYADFAVWQRSWLHGEALEQEIAWWKGQLAGLPSHLSLPTDRPRPAVQSHRGAVRPVRLPATLLRPAAALARREGATLFMVLLAGFQALLARTCGQDDLAVGSPTAGRNRVEVEGLIGFFVNTLVLRGDLTGRPTLRVLLGRVRETALAAHTHQDVPFEKLVEELAPERSLARTPLFQVMLALQNAPVESLEIRDLRLRPLGGAGTTAKFDLTLSLEEHGGELAGTLEYATGLFDAATVDRLIGHFERLLTRALEDPEQPVPELELLSAAERHQLAVEWGGAGGEPLAAPVLHGLFAAQARRAPDAPALTFGETAISYGTLHRRSNQLASWLRRHGVGPESRVGLCVERSPDLVVGILGILKAGGAYVPLDPGHPRERLACMIEDAGVRIVVGTQEQAAALPPAATCRILLDADRELLDALPDEDLASRADGTNLAYVIYTSGSTGRPKGTLVSHGNAVRLFTTTEGWFGFGERDVWTLFHSCTFDFSVWEIWGALLHGGRLVIVPYEVSRSPDLFLDLLVRERVTVLNQTPSAFAQLAHADEERAGAPSALRLVIFGGEALDPAALAPWLARHGDASPVLVNMYGITETTVHVTCRRLCAADVRGERRGVIGAAIPDMSLTVMDRACLRPVPIGVPGELVVGGAGLSRGYLGRPGLTAERFVPDPAGRRPGARLYRSGDLGRVLPDGDVEYLGRVDRQVKIRGFRIEPGEVEAALASLDGVREAVVVAREDPPGGRRLVAYVAGEATPGALRRWLRERLPDYMVPAAFVRLAALPLTPNGKVDRNALPAPGEGSSPETYAAPKTPVEATLAGLWAELLGRERVGVTESFFDLGGHSLLGVRLMAQVAQVFGVRLPMAALFESPTVERLARLVEYRWVPTGSSPLVFLHPGGAGRPLFLVHPVGGAVFDYVELAKKLGAERPVYGLQAVAEGNGHAPRMEDLAARYLAAVRQVQAEGPWLLSGWSSGAVLAYEMARQIESLGGRVALLAMIDPSPPPQGRDAESGATWLLAGFADLGRPSEAQRALLQEMLDGLDVEAGLDRLLELGRAEGVLPAGVEKPWLRERYELFSRNMNALQGYVPQPYGGRVALFRAGASLPPGAADLTSGWSRLARIEAHLIPGADHHSLLRPPALDLLVAQLQADLTQVG